MRELALVVAAGAALLAAPAALAAPPPGAPGCAVFPANNVWNADVSSLPVHPSSAQWLASAQSGSRRLHPDFGRTPYGMPWIVVDNSHPATPMHFDYADESDAGPYPFDAATPSKAARTPTETGTR